ncbi:MAG: hypothetical protein QOG77_3256 [Solirubrobacteraceae bacterium]|nr:hypothetical protein [Solirubrobacteraceae bacterium]
MSTSTSTETAAERRCRLLKREVVSLRREVASLRAVADAVVAAETWDHEVYGGVPEPGWLLIDRDSWARLMSTVDGVDAWRPWSV